MKELNEKERVRGHYGKAAANRSARLKSGEINPARHNHTIRRRLIEDCFRDGTQFRKGIDIGTGTGVWAEFLTKHCERVDGVDFVEENVAIARNSAAELGLADRLQYFQDDVEELSFATLEDYDVAIMISVLQHLPSKDVALRRIHDLLKPGGRFVLLVHNRRCVFNFSLWSAERRGATIPINEYSTFAELELQLKEAGFTIRRRRLAWLFFTDFLFLARGRSYSEALNPVRRILMALSVGAEAVLSRFTVLDPLFREILLDCRRNPT